MCIRPWWIHPYTLKVSCGVLVALLVLWWRAPRYKIERRRLFPWLWAVMALALLGGRAGYVVGHWAYFVRHPLAFFQLDQVGGLHGGSALAGGLIAAWLWARAGAWRLRTVLDFLSPAVLCVAASAWWGCLGVGCAWGREVLVAAGWQQWLVAELPDIYRTVVPRYAVQPIGAVWALTLAAFASVRRDWGAVALDAYVLGTAGLTFLRADVVPQLVHLRSDFVLDLVLFAVVVTATVRSGSSVHISELSRSL